MPEFYNRRAALPSADNVPPGARPWHLIFRSTEEIRLLKVGYNIACFAWEFDILKDETKRDEHPFANQVHMLGLCDEIWVPCNFSRNVLLRHGIATVKVVPAPIRVKKPAFASRREALHQLIAIPVTPMNHNPHWLLEDSMRANKDLLRPLYEWLLVNSPEPEIYISVLNPEDDRKNMNAMFRGFYYYHQQNPNSILLVKLVTSLKRYDMDPAAMMNKLLIHKFTDRNILQSSAILLIPDYLSSEQMDTLYQAADFYLCTSVAEGQNLPLLEAMSNGVVPISPRHTAMLDYLDNDNSVEITSRRMVNFMSNIAASRFGKPLWIDFSDERDVFVALAAAGRLSGPDKRRLSENAIATVHRQYSTDVILDRIGERLGEIRAGEKGAVA